jgi:hypothetical protein
MQLYVSINGGHLTICRTPEEAEAHGGTVIRAPLGQTVAVPCNKAPEKKKPVEPHWNDSDS